MRLTEIRALTVSEQFKNKRILFINNRIELCALLLYWFGFTIRYVE